MKKSLELLAQLDPLNDKQVSEFIKQFEQDIEIIMALEIDLDCLSRADNILAALYKIAIENKKLFNQENLVKLNQIYTGQLGHPWFYVSELWSGIDTIRRQPSNEIKQKAAEKNVAFKIQVFELDDIVRGCTKDKGFSTKEIEELQRLRDSIVKLTQKTLGLLDKAIKDKKTESVNEILKQHQLELNKEVKASEQRCSAFFVQSGFKKAVNAICKLLGCEPIFKTPIFKTPIQEMKKRLELTKAEDPPEEDPSPYQETGL